MKNKRIHRLWLSLLLAAGLVASGGGYSANLNDIFQVAEQLNAQAKRSQQTLPEGIHLTFNALRTLSRFLCLFVPFVAPSFRRTCSLPTE